LLIIKILFPLFAIGYILRRISVRDIINILDSASIYFISLALACFVASKLVSAFRTLIVFKKYSIPVSGWENIKLYWIGMFYNLFLPGGIGGDIYKTVIINNKYESGIRLSAGIVLIDRIAGVVALTVLAMIIAPFTSLNDQYLWISVIGIPVSIIGFYGSIMILIPKLKGITSRLLGLSFIVQVLQILSVFALMGAFEINTNHLEYLLIFLISSVAAVLPVSFGGIGIRELVFFSLSKYMNLDQNVAVTISFTFHLITLIASVPGILSLFENKRIKPVPLAKDT